MNLKVLTSNKLKCIAILLVIIDHIALYFEESLPTSIYITFRIIGRLAMPIFAYMVVQGFFHTKDINKYVSRLFLLGVITQLVIYALYTLNNFVFLGYEVNRAVLKINVIITFAFSLIVIKVIDMIIKCYVSKEKMTKQSKVLTVIVILISAMYIFTEFDYSYSLVIYIILMYISEKLFKEKIIDKKKYYMLLTISTFIFVAVFMNVYELFAIFALPIMFMYNGDRGKRSKTLTVAFYVFYPLQHFLLYLSAMLFAK